MGGDVWEGSTAGSAPMDAALPSVMDVLVETFEDYQEHLSGYMLAGAGVVLVMVPLSLLSVFGLLAALVLGMAPGLITDDELLTVVGSIGGYGLGLTGLILLNVVVFAPMQASVGRAIADRIAEHHTLDIGAAFSTWSTDIGKVIGAHLFVSLLVMLGMVFCYVPGLVAAVMLGFVVPAVIVHRLSPVAAVRLSIRHASEHLAWHLGYFVVCFGIAMACSYIPFFGVALTVTFLQSFQLRCYIGIFGFEPLPEAYR